MKKNKKGLFYCYGIKILISVKYEKKIQLLILSESHHLQKRQANQAVGLFAHPRVGRSDPELEWDNSMMPANGIDDYDGV